MRDPAFKGDHVFVGEDPVNHPYRVQCACGEWCYDFVAHLARETDNTNASVR